MAFDPNAQQVEDKGDILSYDPATGEPIYGKKVAPGGAFEYFVANVGTVYADSLEGVLAKLANAGVTNVSTADVSLLGVTTHKDGN